jgi:hypothetical protein
MGYALIFSFKSALIPRFSPQNPDGGYPWVIPGKKEGLAKIANPLILVAPRDGLEPPTRWLTVLFVPILYRERWFNLTSSIITYN